MAISGRRLVRVVRFALAATFGASFAAASAHAQAQGEGTGSIRGVVRSSDGTPVRGVSVRVAEPRRGAVTSDNGTFTIINVPAGNRVVVVQRIGFRPESAPVVVVAGGTVTRDIVLQPSTATLPAVVVEGQGRIGEALDAQRTAPNLKTVVSEEQLERFPDPQIADALQRLPGVSVQHNFGEASGVALRGLGGRFTNVTVNGERITSTSTTGRGVPLEVMLADLVSEVEVNKAITPDMDADAIGGSINLITRPPEGVRPTGEIRLIGGYNEFSEDPQYQGNFRVSQRVGKLGYALDGSYRSTSRSEEMLRYEYIFEDGQLAGFDRLQLNNYRPERDRYGTGGTLTYDLNDRSHLYLRGMYNYYKDLQLTPEFNLDFGDGDASVPGQITGASVTSFARLQDRRRTTTNLTGGGRHGIGTATLDYSLGYGRAEFDEPRQYRAVFSKDDIDFDVDFSDRRAPRFSAINGTNPYDIAGFNFSDLRITNDNSLDEDLTAAASLELPFTLGTTSMSLEFGGRFRGKERDRDENYMRFETIDDSVEALIPLSNFLSGFRNTSFYNGDYQLGAIPDPQALKNFYDANPGLFDERVADSRESDFGTYAADEDVGAGYAMLTGRMGRLLVLGGVRFEATSTGYSGGAVVLDADGDYVETITESRDRSYSDWFPMLHLRYELTANTNIRFAATRTIARPDYYDLVPWRAINIEDEEIEEGNPDLDPTRSTNLDLAVEHYFQSIGQLSAGVFRKELTDFIYEANSDVVGGDFDGFEVSRPQNGATATVQGIELAWQQSLDFLPGFLAGLGTYTNYTYIDSEGEVEGSDQTIQVPDLSPHLFNLALLYDRAGFSGNFSVHHQSGYLDSPNSAPARVEYFDKITRFDLSATQRINANLRVFMEINNLTNTLHQVYFGNRSVPHERIYYGRWVDAGVRYTF